MNVAGKTITLMGLGVLGRGVNVAKFLLQQGAKLIITDLKTADQLQESIDELADYESQITYVLGGHRLEDFQETDVVVKAAGVPLQNKYIQAATEEGVPVKMDASWCVRELPPSVVTIGVTGTKGKSTVSHLIAYILEQDGKIVYLAGNVRGQATLPLLDHIKAGDYLVLELDSWQLQGFHDEKISPHIAVFTNFMPDHLNYYQGMPEYYFDKAAIYRYQTKKDYLVMTPSSYQAYRQFGNGKPLATTAIVKSNILNNDWHFSQPGEHNRLNAAQAYQVAKFLEISDEQIKTSLESFAGVAGRLELVTEQSGVHFYNDTNATTPEATAASIKAIADLYGKPVVICGGVSKNFPSFSSLVTVLNTYAAAVVLLPGSIGDRIKPDLNVPIIEAQTMSAAVEQAREMAGRYQTKSIVMSPAGSSFGLFKNEYDRGDQFKSAVEDLK